MVRDPDIGAPEASGRRSLDREKTAMQECGWVTAIGLTLAEAMEVITDLGIDPGDVAFWSGSIVMTGVPLVPPYPSASPDSAS